MIKIYFLLSAFSLIVFLIPFFLGLRVRKKIDHRIYTALTVSSIFAVVAIWFFATNGKVEDRLINPVILPSPLEVIQAFPTLHFKQGLVRSVFVSFTRVFLGFSLACIFVFGVGIAMATFPPVFAFFKPIQTSTSYIPTVSFVPLTLAWWGIDNTQKVGFLFIACTISLLPIVINAIKSVEKNYLDVARTKGATEYQLLRHVLIPIAAPDIWNGMRVVFGVGWTWIVLVEMVNAKDGVGYLMSLSEKRGHTDATFALIISIILVSVVCDKLWAYFGKVLFPWKKQV